jgi:hypothetical protein
VNLVLEVRPAYQGPLVLLEEEENQDHLDHLDHQDLEDNQDLQDLLVKMDVQVDYNIYLQMSHDSFYYSDLVYIPVF